MFNLSALYFRELKDLYLEAIFCPNALKGEHISALNSVSSVWCNEWMIQHGINTLLTKIPPVYTDQGLKTKAASPQRQPDILIGQIKPAFIILIMKRQIMVLISLQR